MGSTDVSSYHTDLGDEWDDNGPNIVNDATVTANEIIPNQTSNFTDITAEPFVRTVVPLYLKTLLFLWQMN